MNMQIHYADVRNMIQSSGDVLPLILETRTGSSPSCMIEGQEADSDFKTSTETTSTY